jgi:hypothetical protein
MSVEVSPIGQRIRWLLQQMMLAVRLDFTSWPTARGRRWRHRPDLRMNVFARLTMADVALVPHGPSTGSRQPF